MWNGKAEYFVGYALGKARNVAFAFDDPLQCGTAFGRKMPKAAPSRLLDHHARCPCEIDTINGMVVEPGKQLGIPTPDNQVLTAVMRQPEAGF